MSAPRDPLLIGLCGPAGCGKDTIAGLLCKRHHYEVYAFAEPMRNMIEQLLIDCGLDYAYIHERNLKERPVPGLGVSYRQMAQTLGTEWGRNLQHADFWIRAAEHALGLHAGEARAPIHDRIVVTDVRFANEAQWIRDQGGVVVRVERDTEPVREHVSEQQFDAIVPFTIVDNRGRLSDLEEQVDALAARVAQLPC